MSNTGRTAREAYLATIEKSDPGMHADLLALRSRDPQGFRKRIRTLSTRAGDPIDMLVKLDLTEGYAGRARDGDLERRADAIVNSASRVKIPTKEAGLFEASASDAVTGGAVDDPIAPKKPARGKGAKGEEVSKENVYVKAEDTTAEAAAAPIGISADAPVADEKPKKGTKKKKAE